MAAAVAAAVVLEVAVASEEAVASEAEDPAAVCLPMVVSTIPHPDMHSMAVGEDAVTMAVDSTAASWTC